MIKITNLNKYFYHKKSNEIHVINNASFEFPKTGLITIFGESGSGKTTLMNVLGGLDDFYDGTIQIDDFTIKKYNSRKIDRIRNEKIGYKIREAAANKVPYMIIVGDGEKENNTISIRGRGNESASDLKLDDFIARLNKQVAEKK